MFSRKSKGLISCTTCNAKTRQDHYAITALADMMIMMIMSLSQSRT